jgi:hypothetical protein
MAAGTALVTRGAPTMTTRVTMPTTMACQRHLSGAISEAQKYMPLGVPSSLGTWLAMMIRPTPER